MADGDQPNNALANVRDHQNVNLQCPKLTSTNYSSWSVVARTILGAYGLSDAIDPVTGGAVDNRKNQTAMAILFQALPEDILLQVAKYARAHEVWEAIRVRFLGADRVQKARIHVLRSELEMLKMKETETIDEFAAKISAIEGKFNNLGTILEPEVQVRKLFNSLPIRFLPIVASIEQSEDLETMPFEEAIGRLKAFEDRVKLYAGNDGDAISKLLFTVGAFMSIAC